MNNMQTKNCKNNNVITRRPLRATRFIVYAMIACLSLGAVGCKSSKKAAQAKAEQEARLAKEREAKLKREEAEKLKKEKQEEEAKKAPYLKVENSFNQIVSAGSVDVANKNIEEALTLFTSPDAPLLISISKQGETKDYDKPTTIKKYLEYLKDQKKNLNVIDNLVFDENGKIKEVELRKK